MRTEPFSDPGTLTTPDQPQRVKSGLADEVGVYVASALRVEKIALDLAQRNMGDNEAIAELIEAAGRDVRIMRRAHRHCEFALSEQWPAGRTLIRAFDYLSASRRELEKGRSRDPHL